METTKSLEEQWRTDPAYLAEWANRAMSLLVRVAELEDALRNMRELASVAHNGDSWYAENEGLDAHAIFDQTRKALGEE